MKVVYYPKPEKGEGENIVGWISSGKNGEMVSLKVGEMVDLEDDVADQLCMVYKFLKSYDEEEFAKAFPLELARKQRKADKEKAAAEAEEKEKIKEVVEEVKEEKEEKEIEKGEVFVCEVCEKVCKSKAGLSAHMRSHEDEEVE